MTSQEYIRRIREYLHDPECKVWDDEELLEMILDAAVDYSKDTGLFRGCFHILTDKDGVSRLPKNYLAFLAGWNVNENKILSTSSDDLARFYGNYTAVDGLPEYVYEELDNIGNVRFCPNPHNVQKVTVYLPSSIYGLVVGAGYGIPSASEDYGIPVTVYKFRKCGDIVYIRSEAFENIQDYMALIYHVLWQAFSIDSDFQDMQKAALYNAQYKARVARCGQIKTGVKDIRRSGRFF